MKLNKIWTESKRTITVPVSGELEDRPAQCSLRYLKENGKYHLWSIFDVSQIGELPDVTDCEKELIEKSLLHAQTLSEETDIKSLHFFCGRERADVRENPVTKQPEIVGTTEESGFGTVAVKWKGHKQASQVKPDDENMENLHPELKGFCDCVFGIEKNGKKLWPELYRLQQEKIKLKNKVKG